MLLAVTAVVFLVGLLYVLDLELVLALPGPTNRKDCMAFEKLKEPSGHSNLLLRFDHVVV